MRTRSYEFRERAADALPSEAERDVPGKLVPGTLVLLLAACGALLYALDGPPQLPVRPDPQALLAALRSADPPLAGAASWCFAAGWALWLWTAMSLLVQGLLAGLAAATRGAAWVRSLHRVIAPLLMPLARRAFPFVTAGVLVARLAMLTPAAGAADPPAPVTLVYHRAEPPTGLGAQAGLVIAIGARTPSLPVEHVVAEGDTLRALAARYYGTGDEFARLHEANLGRPMPDGTRYEGRLRPGQVLVVPPAGRTLEHADGQTVYVVEEGDTLRGIAARFLGDEMRWPEIFTANKGTARLPDGRTLTNPDLIWPGLRLVIPVDATPAHSAPPSPAAPAPPAAHVAPRAPAPAPPAPPTPPPATPAPPPVSIPATRPVMTPPALPTPLPTICPAPAPASTGATPTTTVVAASPPATGDPGRAPLIDGALAAAVLGGSLFLARRRLLARRELRRRLRAAGSPAVAAREERESGATVAFAEAEAIETFTHRAHGGEVEPAVTVAHHARRFFAEQGLDGAVPLIAIQEEHGATSLLLDAPRAERDRLTELAPTLGALLGGKGRAVPLRATGDVEVRLTGLTAAALLAPLAGRADRPAPTFLPLVALPGAAPLFANWDALGHVLVAGGPGEGADIALTALIATLASRRHPETLRLWAVAPREALPPELWLLPHWSAPPIDPGDTARVGRLLRELRGELDRRRSEPPDTPRPELVLVMSEMADLVPSLADDGTGTTLELLSEAGPDHGIRLLAGTAHPAALDDGLLRHFATRLVLRLDDEAQSVRLLGAPDAVALGGGGRLLLRLAGRPPRALAGVAADQLRGYRIAPRALRELAEQMRAAYGQRDGEDGEAASRPDSDNAPVDQLANDAASDALEWDAEAADSGAVQSDLDLSMSDPPPTSSMRATGSPEADASAAGDISGNGHRVGMVEEDLADAAEDEPWDGDGSEQADSSHGESGSAVCAEPHPPAVAVTTTWEPGARSQRERSSPNGAGAHAAGSTDCQPHDGNGQEGSDVATGQDGQRITVSTTASGDEAPAAGRRVADAAGRDDAASEANSAGVIQMDEALSLAQLTPDMLAIAPAKVAAPATALEIRCFGAFRVLHGSAPLAPRRHLKAWELLQLLAAHPPRSLNREKMLVALWPDPDASPNRNVVNALVGRLREELVTQVPGLAREVVRQARNGDCWLDPELVTVDVHEWLALVERQPKLPLAEALEGYRQAQALYRPALLAGASFEWLYPRDEDGLELAEDYRDTWRRSVLHLARRCVREARADLAIPLYRRLMVERPRDEAIARELFRCYGLTGDLPGLEREARLLESALREAYGDDQDDEQQQCLDGPSKETFELLEAIRGDLATRIVTRESAPSGPRSRWVKP